MGEIEKVKKKEGTFFQRPDKTLIAGFYKGEDPQHSDNNTVWCVHCKDEAPESTRENPINPIIYKMYDQFEGESFTSSLDGIVCDECGKKLPVK